MKFFYLVLLLSFMGHLGCASAQKIVGPDGTDNILVTCDSVELCYQKATEVCNGTYKIVNSNSNTSGYNGITGTSINLLVKCDKEVVPDHYEE